MAVNTGYPLRIARLRFSFALSRTARLPAYLGSAWRGVFGHALHAATSPHPRDQCTSQCPCAYRVLFAPFAPKTVAGISAGIEAPPPLVFHALPRADKPAQLQVVVTLIGLARAYAPLVVAVMEHAGTLGLGWSRVQAMLTGVDLEKKVGSGQWQPYWRAGAVCDPHPDSVWDIPPQRETRLLIRLQPPALRIKRRSRYLLETGQFHDDDFPAAVALRWNQLTGLYAEQHQGPARPVAPPGPGQFALVDRQIDAAKFKRRSNPQDRHVKMDGLAGCFGVEADLAPAFWTALWQCQWLHIGKGCSVGLGGYRLESVKSQNWQLRLPHRAALG